MGAEFLAEAFHVRVEGAAVGGVAVAPDRPVQDGSVLGFSGVLAEKQ